MREQIVESIRNGVKIEKVAQGLHRKPAFIRKVYLEWQRDNVAAARRRRDGE